MTLMKHLKKKALKRIITCQGSIQLLTAIAALNYINQEQDQQNSDFENYLVIYGLYAPPGQDEQFAAFIEKMARLLFNWKNIVYIKPDQINEISSKLNSTSPSKTFQKIYELVGISFADEIYLCGNWLIGNQLIMNAYDSAQKICYGDGIGIYISPSYKAFFPSSNQARLGFISTSKFQVKATISKLKELFHLKTVLKTIEFDTGYFTLPSVLGEPPPIKNIVLGMNGLLKVLHKLRGHLINSNYLDKFHNLIDSKQVVVLLTSNFSETGRMSLENEIIAYHKFLSSQKEGLAEVLVIKPHPRDNPAKLEKLKHTLIGLFAQVIVLSEPDLFFLPFELFFIEAFLHEDLTPRIPVEVFAVSTACLSLKLLFNVPSMIGFGNQITTELFFKDWMPGRLEHESHLKALLGSSLMSI